MTQEIALINEDELSAFASSVGANSEDLQGTNFLPSLKVNYNEENPETGKELKRGTLFLTGQDVTVYAKTVTIRPLMQYFQWVDYDVEAKKITNRTRFISHFGEEARDEKGTVRCGKPASKEIKANPGLKKMYESITCNRQIYALISYVGEDENGTSHTVTDVLATVRLKGDSFTPFQDEYIAQMPKNTRLWDFSASVYTTKKKNDPSSATTYFVVHFEPDFKNVLPVTSDVFNTLKAIKAEVDEINRDIDHKYYASISSKNEDDEAINALDITASSLAADFENA